ncbi:hypothetical protein GPUN_0705 [Glaciecola punicea ACAM 611]|uniref:Uncharacterized protein n=1 Tax=Glaciecola punicea ACAM 611 TaxID=1121923 RepID=H5T967_9ALTE|nr:hypothetical protein GPUN_0705 [Glaciecola punicea ACAM 611]
MLFPRRRFAHYRCVAVQVMTAVRRRGEVALWQMSTQSKEIDGPPASGRTSMAQF